MSLLIIANENDDFVFKHELGTQDEAEEPVLPMLIAYAALDFGCFDRFEGYSTAVHHCASGHRIVIVGKELKANTKRFFTRAEAALCNEILNIYVDDSEWLPSEFGAALQEIWHKL